MKPEILIEATPEILVQKTAEKLVAAANESIAARGVFSFALAGGSTPKSLYQLLATEKWRDKIDWSKTHIFFGDERAVAPDDEYSNYRMAREAFLDSLMIPVENIHRMRGEEAELENAAYDYENELQKYAPLDVVLLGMGDDGHTASLFPGSPALSASGVLCVATPLASLEPQVRRLTLTFYAINTACHVWVLVTGAGKAERLRGVLSGIESNSLDIQSTPIQGVQPQGEYLWLLDEAAAKLISR
jgi:6-phosphogluconolactonase